AAETQGSRMDFTAGTAEGERGVFRPGGTVGKADYRVSSRFSRREGMPLATGACDKPRFSSNVGACRMDWAPGEADQVLLEGNLFSGLDRRMEGEWISTPPYRNYYQVRDNSSASSLMGRWRRKLSETSSTQLQVAFDNQERGPHPGLRTDM